MSQEFHKRFAKREQEELKNWITPQFDTLDSKIDNLQTQIDALEARVEALET